MRGLILFAHGARDPQWARPFEQTAQRVASLEPGLPVQLAFLEFMSPDLPGAGANLAAAGCTEVDVVPLFLGAGGHVRKDLPALIEGLRASHPGVRWTLQPAVGESPALVDTMARIAVQTAAEDPTR